MSRCGLTPYCSGRCQRRDWGDRHRSVCHNLARLAGKTDQVEQTSPEKNTVPQAAPLRRPHSPVVKTPPRKDEDAMPDLTSNKTPSIQNNKQQAPRNNFNHGPRNFNNNNSNYNKNRQNDRKQQRQDSGQDEQEDWGNKNVKTPAPTTPPVSSVPKPVTEPVSAPQPKQSRPEPEEPKPSPKPSSVRPPGSISATTPAKTTKKLVPKNYLIELLSPGDTALLSVEASASDCRSTRGFVCLSMHERFETQYQDLCEQYTVDCDAENATVKPSPGDSFSYLNPADGGWYRARCLTPALAALVDSSKVVPLTSSDKLKVLPAKYEQAPEFCCVLNAKDVKIGQNLKCNLIAKTSDGYKVSLEDVETGAPVGEGEVSRWLPTVEYPPVETAPLPIPVTAQPQIPEVARPDVVNNSKVLLVDMTAVDRAFVRPSDTASQRRFDQILEDVVMAGRDAVALKEPPQKGQVVIGKFSDGLFYRALCKRTNVKQNKYLLEYIEFGNVEVTPLENIYPCPPNLDLSNRPTEASLVTMQCKCPGTLTKPAMEYLDVLKDNVEELTLTFPSGATSAASGSAVVLTIVKSNENVNRKLEQMCTPEWKKMEERGADVIETKPLQYSDLETLELPENGCELDVLDMTALAEGTVSCCQRGLPHQTYVLTKLTEQMAEYCNSELGKEPYLPKFEELCIAQCPPYPQWFRAVLLEQSPGSATARVCYVDYGNVEEVPVTLLRKMLPEFVRHLPALASHLEIKDFPENVTTEMLTRAIEHMQITDEGRGVLKVTRCEKQDVGLYLAHAPDLIKAMLGH